MLCTRTLAGLPSAMLAAMLAWLVACADEQPLAEPFADEVVAFTPAEGTVFGHDALPDVVLGAPGGVYDVASLGCGGSIVLRFDEPGIVDGPGADLIVFENAFTDAFPEPAEVAVSEDGVEWLVFACDPISLDGCAGRSPTRALPDSGIDPTDPTRAGGDAFDLAALPAFGPGAPAQISFVRIEDRSRAYWEALGGMTYCDPSSGGSGGFDLDAIVAVHSS